MRDPKTLIFITEIYGIWFISEKLLWSQKLVYMYYLTTYVSH